MPNTFLNANHIMSEFDTDTRSLHEDDNDDMELYVQEYLLVLKPMIVSIQIHAMGKLGKILKSFFDELYYTHNDPLPWIRALANRIHYLWQPSDGGDTGAGYDSDY